MYELKEKWFQSYTADLMLNLTAIQIDCIRGQNINDNNYRYDYKKQSNLWPL